MRLPLHLPVTQWYDIDGRLTLTVLPFCVWLAERLGRQYSARDLWRCRR